MTQSGNSYDNAKTERINRTIKNELIYPFGQIVDVEEAKRKVQEAVSRYNNIRLHQNLSYNTPNSIHLNSKPANELNIQCQTITVIKVKTVNLFQNNTDNTESLNI